MLDDLDQTAASEGRSGSTQLDALITYAELAAQERATAGNLGD